MKYSENPSDPMTKAFNDQLMFIKEEAAQKGSSGSISLISHRGEYSLISIHLLLSGSHQDKILACAALLASEHISTNLKIHHDLKSYIHHMNDSEAFQTPSVFVDGIQDEANQEFPINVIRISLGSVTDYVHGIQPEKKNHWRISSEQNYLKQFMWVFGHVKKQIKTTARKESNDPLPAFEDDRIMESDKVDEEETDSSATVWFIPMNNSGGGISESQKRVLAHDNLQSTLQTGKFFKTDFLTSNDDLLSIKENDYVVVVGTVDNIGPGGINTTLLERLRKQVISDRIFLMYPEKYHDQIRKTDQFFQDENGGLYYSTSARDNIKYYVFDRKLPIF